MLITHLSDPDHESQLKGGDAHAMRDVRLLNTEDSQRGKVGCLPGPCLQDIYNYATYQGIKANPLEVGKHIFAKADG